MTTYPGPAPDRRVGPSAESTLLTLAILGVPGGTHLRETVKLLTRRLHHARRIEIFVLERCIRPLYDIAFSLKTRKFENVAVPPPSTISADASPAPAPTSI